MLTGPRRKEALIGGGVSLAFIALAILVVLHQSPDQAPNLAANTPIGTVSPQVLGTVFTIPSPSPDPADSSELAPPPAVETELLISTVTALSTQFISGSPVVQTAFRTTTATQKVTLPPEPPKPNKTVLSTRTFLATITQAGVVTVTTQTATATQTLYNTTTQTQFNTTTQTQTNTQYQTQTNTQYQTQTQTKTQTQTQTQTETQTQYNTTTQTQYQTETQTATKTVTAPPVTQTVTETDTETAPGPTVTVTETATCTFDPVLLVCQ